MQGQLAKPLDMMAILTDKKSRGSEVIDIDYVYVLKYTIDNFNRSAQFVVVFGGKDKAGKLYVCPENQRPLTQVTIPGDTFGSLFEDENGNPLRELSQALLDRVFAEHVLPACNKLSWALADIDVSIDGKSVFSSK